MEHSTPCPQWFASLPASTYRSRPPSSLRQPRLAHPVNPMLDILGVLEDEKTFVFFNCETWVDPQHLRGFRSRLVKLSRLRIGGCEPNMGPLQIGQARCAFAQQTHSVPVALEHVIGEAQPTCRVEERLKRIEAH